VIASEARWFPVIVVSFRGPYTRAIIDDYFVEQTRISKRAVRDDTYLVSVARSDDAPDAQARRWIAEATQAMPDELRKRTLRSYCIVDSALQRGVVTAMSWLFKDMAELEAVATEDEAVAALTKLLASRGIAPPMGLDAAALRSFFSPDAPMSLRR
jgi:hypothetical protein